MIRPSPGYSPHPHFQIPLAGIQRGWGERRGGGSQGQRGKGRGSYHDGRHGAEAGNKVALHGGQVSANLSLFRKLSLPELLRRVLFASSAPCGAPSCPAASRSSGGRTLEGRSHDDGDAVVAFCGLPLASQDAFLEHDVGELVCVLELRGQNALVSVEGCDLEQMADEAGPEQSSLGWVKEAGAGFRV